ncbi:MAG: hypothetical protein IPP01_10720 [Saprospiraceae bacterium]|nr:hypothetical protein [Saprospiraceae bacterium]
MKLKAWIPGVNFAEWCKLIGRKPSHAWWLLFPLVNIFIWTGMAIDLVRSFGKLSFMDSFWAVVFPPYIFNSIAKDPNVKYIEPAYQKNKNTSMHCMMPKSQKITPSLIE